MLDDEFTSGGSIRRTRHKPIFVNQLRNSNPCSSTSNQLIPFLSPRNDGERTTLESVKNLTGFERENTFYSREAMTKELCLGQCIPPQSSETARKILEHLDRMVPSPKEISAEAQLAIARDKSSRFNCVVEVSQTINPEGTSSSKGSEWKNLEAEHRVYSQLARNLMAHPIDKGCIHQPISASSTDNFPDESIMYT